MKWKRGEGYNFQHPPYSVLIFIVKFFNRFFNKESRLNTGRPTRGPGGGVVTGRNQCLCKGQCYEGITRGICIVHKKKILERYNYFFYIGRAHF